MADKPLSFQIMTQRIQFVFFLNMTQRIDTAAEQGETKGGGGGDSPVN